MESIQYNAALAITGAIRGSYREKLHQELGLESLQQRRWYRKLCYFFKLTKNKSPTSIYSIISRWLDKSIKNSESFSIFKKNILKFIRPSPNSIFNCHNPKGVKLLTRLRLGLSHLVIINLSTVFKIR